MTLSIFSRKPSSKLSPALLKLLKDQQRVQIKEASHVGMDEVKFKSGQNEPTFFTTGLGPCIAVALYNDAKLPAVAFTHLSNDTHNKSEMQAKRAILEQMLQKVQAASPNGVIKCSYSPGTFLDKDLEKMIKLWLTEKKIDYVKPEQSADCAAFNISQGGLAYMVSTHFESVVAEESNECFTTQGPVQAKAVF